MIVVQAGNHPNGASWGDKMVLAPRLLLQTGSYCIRDNERIADTPNDTIGSIMKTSEGGRCRTMCCYYQSGNCFPPTKGYSGFVRSICFDLDSPRNAMRKGVLQAWRDVLHEPPYQKWFNYWERTPERVWSQLVGPSFYKVKSCIGSYVTLKIKIEKQLMSSCVRLCFRSHI